MQNPKDPKFGRQGNRLFRNAAQQGKRKPGYSWVMVAAAVTFLFVSAAGAFWYSSLPPKDSGAPAPPAIAAVSTPESTPAAAQVTPTPEPTPAPTPTPEPTPTPAPKAKIKTVKPATPIKEKVAGGKKVVEPASTKKTAKTKTDAKARATTKTAKKGAPAVPGMATVSEEPLNQPELKETPRPRFNMNPESERSANTDRVNKLEEFPSDTPPGKSSAAKKSPEVITTPFEIKNPARDANAPAVPLGGADEKKSDGNTVPTPDPGAGTVTEEPAP